MIVTGSAGLIGSEAAEYFSRVGWLVTGVDNNMRADFFGPRGDTSWNLQRLKESSPTYEHQSVDIRDRQAVLDLFAATKPDAIIHAAAQPSHDLAASRPFDDFDVNAGGTLNLLEATRQHAPESPFVFLSTNKVYGDAPNNLPLTELETRWDYADEDDYHGIDESCATDQVMHSLFGASKLAADVLVQEYGRYFGMPTVCFRGGCLTGPNHSGVELHGFLSYLVKTAVEGRKYTIFGYKGKQVRDQIFSGDVVRACEAFIRAPRSGAVYNMGGGRDSNASILECFTRITELLGCEVGYDYTDEHRTGDHICYISDTRRFRSDYPAWSVTKSLDDMIVEIGQACRAAS
ncbi:NAD-dependent epimerase/dehydratase family protein [Candidatus Poribacteria bacterium]|nr:NAD-dependent epimerase/dehydratase family protein [Candidatus Poribacteria bacterium]